MPAAARTLIACGKCVWALAGFVFLISVILVGNTFVRLIDVTILEWLETLAKTLAPSQRTMVTALTCVAGGFVVAWAFEISRQHGEGPTIRTIVNSFKSSFVSFLWLLFNRSRRYSILVLACAALGSSSGAVPIGVFVRIVAVFLLRWAFVKLAARRHFALLSTWQSRTTLLALLGSLYTCGILYHISYNTYADRITGRSRVIVTSERFETQVGRAVWNSTLTNHKILPSTSRRHKLVTRIGARLSNLATGGSASGTFEWDFRVIERDDPNAFAIAGGKVAIHTGLLDMLQDDEDAIAFVLGHEIGHCMLRHTFETAATKDVFLVPLMEALEIVSGVDFFSSVDGLTGTFVQSIVVDWLDLFPSMAFSHMHEYEADRLGAYFAAAACFNAKNGAEQLFGALEKYEKESTELNISFAVREILKHEYLKTHPNSEKRVSNVLTLVAGPDFGRTRGICQHAKRCQLARQELQASKASSFKLNERVECRDYGKEWYVGRVVSVEPLKVHPDGFTGTRGYTWDEVRVVGRDVSPFFDADGVPREQLDNSPLECDALSSMVRYPFLVQSTLNVVTLVVGVMLLQAAVAIAAMLALLRPPPALSLQFRVKFKALQEELAQKKIEAMSADGGCTVVVSGALVPISVEVTEALLAKGSKAVSEAVSVAAKEAHTNSKSYAQEQMAQAGMLTTCKDVRNAGYSCKDAREAGFSYKEAREAGFTCKDAREAGFTCKDVREAGFTCKDAREAGFKPLECAQAGFTYEEGKVAGYPSHIGGNQTSEYWWRMGGFDWDGTIDLAAIDAAAGIG